MLVSVAIVVSMSLIAATSVGELNVGGFSAFVHDASMAKHDTNGAIVACFFNLPMIFSFVEGWKLSMPHQRVPVRRQVAPLHKASNCIRYRNEGGDV
jgi:hypothetical protein